VSDFLNDKGIQPFLDNLSPRMRKTRFVCGKVKRIRTEHDIKRGQKGEILSSNFVLPSSLNLYWDEFYGVLFTSKSFVIEIS